MTETFDTFDPKPGEVVHLEPGIRLILAPNPSPMTFLGTNTYLLGTRDVVVVDPGPDRPAHLNAILAALDPGETVSAIIVTHTHIDHSPLARLLQDITGAEILAFGDATAGRSPVMARLAVSGLVGGGEGIDCAFQPDRRVKDGDQIVVGGGTIDVIHTPGHLGNHIALGWRDACLTADHVMGWASSLVSPPDGDLTEFMASCHRLRARDWRVFYPGHGAPIWDPGGRLDWLISHREGREAAILEALRDRADTAAGLAQRIYTDTLPALLPAAERNVLAHLIDLMGKTRVAPQEDLRADAVFLRLDSGGERTRPGKSKIQPYPLDVPNRRCYTEQTDPA